MNPPDHQESSTAQDSELTAAIRSSSAADPVETALRTDERVLARVTDGIYRQPGSAIRELISNAYDADAEHVWIKTDRPRFGSIWIVDDGSGMTPDMVAHLVHHIGGSAKRTDAGAELGVTAASDPTLSPAGRKLIGRIGIGLFSIAQLTDRFQIITKTEGEALRTVATVVLKHFSEDVDPQAPPREDGYEAGKVKIWTEPASDEDEHGTSIVLNDIRPQTRDTLQSRDLWSAIDADAALGPDESRRLAPPRFHIGRVDPDHQDLLRGDVDAPDSVPWLRSDPAGVAYRKLVDAVWYEAQTGGVPNLQLERIFDYYLQMVWLQLGLAIPAAYVEGHPFDIPFGDTAYTYELPANMRTPKELPFKGDQTFRELLSLEGSPDKEANLAVYIDDLLIQRPLYFQNLPTTAHQVKKPIIFAGSWREDFANVPRELSSGPLEYDAYLMWAPKIVPTEHQGVLIRIHGSSGTLFDPTFMRYQVSEQTRLRQITCEVFVRSGLEGALNIDRESFNYAHPHVVYLTKWLHVALRRLATVQKRVSAEIREEARHLGEGQTQEKLDSIVTTAWTKEADDEGQAPPDVTFVDNLESGESKKAKEQSANGGYRFRRNTTFGSPGSGSAASRKKRALERKLAAVIKLLAAYQLLDALSGPEQERLVGYLREILEADDE